MQAVSPETAFLVTDIISDNAARAPIFGENSRLKLSRPAAAKTGTTTNFRDNWTVGFTKYLVAGVWAGNNDGRPMRNADGITGAGPIWNKFMEAVLADPAMLQTLNAPAEAEAWDFDAACRCLAGGAHLPARTELPRGGRVFLPALARTHGGGRPLRRQLPQRRDGAGQRAVGQRPDHTAGRLRHAT